MKQISSLLALLLIQLQLLTFAPSIGLAQAPPVTTLPYVNNILVDGSRVVGVELSDGGVGNSDLSGLTVVLLDRATNQSNAAYDLTGLSTNEDGTLVLGIESLTPAPTVPIDRTALSNSNAVAIYAGEATNYAAGITTRTENRIELTTYGFDTDGELSIAVTRDSAVDQLAPAADAASRAAPPANFGACGDPATTIDQIQGSGASSLLLGKIVTVDGTVVGDFQDRKTQMRGFFLQENESEADDDPTTSEGIFILDGGQGLDVSVGDQVRVQGKVSEFNGMTRLNNLQFVQFCSAGLPIEPIMITLPLSSTNELEQFEGMYVQLANEMTVAQNYFIGRYGQMTLAVGGRPLQPTHLFAPDSDEAQAQANLNARSMIVLDDGQEIRELGDNPNPVPYLGAPPPAVIRAGDVVTKLIGILDQGRINSAPWPDIGLGYRLQPIETPLFSSVNPRPQLPPDVSGTLRIASANVLNYFNGDGLGGGFPTERGAPTLAEFERQRAKTIAAITGLNADIVGLMEIENDGYGENSAIQDLVNGLNAANPISSTASISDSDSISETYALINPGMEKLGSDAIKVGLLYKPGVVTPVGNPATLDSGAFDQTLPDGKSRQPLAQTFAMSDGQKITVVVLHLKSKRPGTTDDPTNIDNGNGTGSWNGRRTEAAQQIADWLATDPTGSGSDNRLIIGDLNAYAGETPISTLETAGYTNLLKKFNGDEAYSYVFDGQSGYLDHALASTALVTQVVSADDWHINTDEPKVIDYDASFNPPGYYAADPYRASDHDPVLIGISLSATITDTEEGGDETGGTEVGGEIEAFVCAYRYTVQPGDTLSWIAIRNGVSYFSLIKVNKIENPNWIYVGQSLCIPGTGEVVPPKADTYVVKPGDTLYAIAYRLGVSPASIMRANGIWNPDFIYVGQVLTIPR